MAQWRTSQCVPRIRPVEQFLALTDMILGKGRVLSTLNAMDVAGHHSQSEVLCTGEHQPPK